VFVQNNYSKRIYYFVIFIGLVSVLFTHPFLRYPYDVIAHLIAIDELYHGAITSSTSIQPTRLIWHAFWAKLFYLFSIDSTHFFLRAYIIHIIQLYITLFSLYYFSHVFIRNIFKQIDTLTLQYLSLFSVLIWITLFSTSSGYYHQIWTLWYSVNYQLTLPLFWYITALTLVLFLEKISITRKIFFSIQILLISKFILQVHAMEFLYYLMYISLFSLLYVKQIYQKIKQYYYVIIPLILGVIYFIQTNISESSKIFNYFNLDKLPLLYDKISSEGQIIVQHLNRASDSINELMIVIFFISIAMIVSIFLKRKQEPYIISIKLLIFITISSLFIIIPLFEFSSGLFSIITRSDVIHRIYYSSSIFLLFPISLYYFSATYHISLKYISIITLTIILLTILFSYSTNLLSHNYYKNIQSLGNSFTGKRINFHLSKEQINTVGKILDNYEQNNHSGKETYYYARTDIAFVIKYIYHKNVLWKGRRINPNHIQEYQDKRNNTYHHILIETPQGFPKYIPYW